MLDITNEGEELRTTEAELSPDAVAKEADFSPDAAIEASNRLAKFRQ